MFKSLGNFVSRHWFLVIVAWLCLLAGLKLVAPAWDEVTYDGDLAYLPDEMSSVVGEKMLAEAFPHKRSKSQIVVITSRDEKLMPDDIYVALDLARRFKNLQGIAGFERAKAWFDEHQAGRPPAPIDPAASPDPQESDDEQSQGALELEDALAAFDEAIEFDLSLESYWNERITANPEDEQLRPTPLAEAYHNRAILLDYIEAKEDAERDRADALSIDPGLSEYRDQLMPQDATNLPIVDVWTWHDEVFGKKLMTPGARLISLRLSNEFMAVDNIRVLERVEAELLAVRERDEFVTEPGLAINISGSAAVGGDMRRSAIEGIKHTELFTVVLVVLILGMIYRSPLLVAVPLVSISISLVVAVAVITLLTQLHTVPGFGWWGLKVFTTTKIFIVVILFGAGTDYCLFLIARYREELEKGIAAREAIANALSGVGDALSASALTTILGLGMMYFSDFGKFRYSGPVIGLCLVVTLLTCVTLTPAILRGLGTIVFWPSRLAKRDAGPHRNGKPAAADNSSSESWIIAVWEPIARLIVARPGLLMVLSVFLMTPVAWYGHQNERNVTYDFLSSLSHQRPSRIGTTELKKHFPVGDTGPIVVLVEKKNADFSTRESRQENRHLTDLLYVPGVAGVRSAMDPLGELPPNKRTSISLPLIREHRRVKEIFLSDTIARFEVLPEQDPFANETIEVINALDQRLREVSEQPGYWQGCRFAFAGTTAGIRDLRAVTQSDNTRIKFLVVLAVAAVLFVILRRPVICIYMILTVLFSYYVTIGITQAFFMWVYADTYQGLDWKLPLFLFVILVAIGQDYNVYLATRVFEEQAEHGPFTGLRRAVVMTGGIITSCGLIMAGTFFSMTSATWGQVIPAWLPFGNLFSVSGGALREIVELGFALSLGVLLDTFVVRPILVPAFIALLARMQHGPSAPESPDSTVESTEQTDASGRAKVIRPKSAGLSK